MNRTAPLQYRRTLSGFEPMTQAAKEEHAKCKLGQPVYVYIRRPRNAQHHRKLFALLSILVDNTDQFSSVDDALIAVKAVTGHGRWVRLHPKATREMFVPDSIDFASMPQSEFEAFYTLAVAAIRRWWLPVEDSELAQTVNEFAA